ncbi:membrane fusion protein, multidrug efflux system [Methylomarinovum caldicuralii]|uniref:Membrane fusion protein, multidrug efflux system n=1 Tax=Methylomarinovum caldicuralii TaxID=438856 RepID=A0AAU9CQ81_9GAMM|nr:efflux RND transporter periplasmic adaptor subunit [Methylomarinovum caldicuralii]BCX81657.1 membrane fusion protein, multidrug efflux system [Methylomarinovum caldicuralii]
MKLTSKLVWGPLAFLGLVLLLAWVQGAFATKVPPGNTGRPGKTVSGPTVAVAETPLPRRLRWPGTVSADTVAHIAPKIPGRILEIGVDIGSRVEQGQLLARLEDSEIRARLKAAQAALAAAQAQAQRAAADARRIRNLFRQQAATQRDLDAAVAAERTAKAQVEQARQQIQAIRSQLKETRLYAPFAGSVIERLADPGDMGMPGQPILVLQNPHRLEVYTHVPESCAVYLRPGTGVRIEIPGRRLQLMATVTETAAAADPFTHTIEVKAALPAGQDILPGAFAWVGQSCGEETVLLLPQQTVRRVGQLEEVDLVREGRVQTRLVRTGRRIDGQVEILSGLKAGERVQLPGDGGNASRGRRESLPGGFTAASLPRRPRSPSPPSPTPRS